MAGAGTGLRPKRQIMAMDNDERIARIERFSEQARLELQSIDVRLTRIESSMATKTDLERAINSIVKWVVGTILGASVAAVAGMTFILNNAVPRQAPPAPTAPFIIQLPPGTQVIPKS